jgi:predicted transcriptional regulator
MGQNNELIGRLEELEDALALRAIEANPERREYVPVEILDRMLAGEHPLRVWREHSGLTMLALAEKSAVAQSYISEIETGRKPGSVAALKNLAGALGVTVDDIIP